MFSTYAPLHYRAGLQVIPLHAATKKPAVSGWQKYADIAVPSEVAMQWQASFAGGNIGLVLGAESGVTVIDIDTDDANLVAVIKSVLPLSPWERIGKKGVALAYRHDGGATFRLADASGAMIVERLASRAQVVLPPSIHPDTKLPYTSNSNLYDPAVLAQLVPLPQGVEGALRVALAGAGVQLRKSGAVRRAVVPAGAPGAGGAGAVGPGGRDVAGTAKAGELARQVREGWLTLQEAIEQAERWCRENFTGPDAPDPAKFGLKVVEFFLRDCQQFDKNGKTERRVVFGQFDADGNPLTEPDLRAPFGYDKGLSDNEKQILGLNSVRLFRGEFWFRRHFILVERTGSFVHKTDRYEVTEVQLLNMEAGRFVAFHPQTRRQIDTLKRCSDFERVKDISMYPGCLTKIVERGGYRFLNSWQGFSQLRIQSATDIDVAPFLTLVTLMVPVHEQRTLLLDWMSHLFQKPADKIMFAVFLLSSANGVGKGTLAGVLKKLLGPHAKEITTEDLLSDFNSYLQDATFVFIDEVYSPDKREITSKLKTLITSGVVQINEKYQKQREASNYANFMLASNKADAIRLDTDDRRFFVIRIEDEQAELIKARFDWWQFNEWFDDIINQGRMIDWFMSRDLSKFDPKGRAPITEAKSTMIALSKPAWQGWLDQALGDRAGPFIKELTTVRLICLAIPGKYGAPSQGSVGEWCKISGMRLLQHKVKIDKGSGIKAPVRVWVVARPEFWAAATPDQVRAELVIQAGWGAVGQEAARVVGWMSDHAKKDPKSPATGQPVGGAVGKSMNYINSAEELLVALLLAGFERGNRSTRAGLPFGWVGPGGVGAPLGAIDVESNPAAVAEAQRAAAGASQPGRGFVGGFEPGSPVLAVLIAKAAKLV